MATSKKQPKEHMMRTAMAKKTKMSLPKVKADKKGAFPKIGAKKGVKSPANLKAGVRIGKGRASHPKPEKPEKKKGK